MLKRNRRWFSTSTLIFFLVFELFYFPAQNGFAQNLVSEVKSAQGFFLALPKDLGRVEITHTGQGPSLIHIQTAHGNYEAEQNIRKILHYLKNEHDFKTVFLEGSAFKLEPERLKLFKKHKKITYQILDQLMRRAFVKGSELFLLEDSEAQGFGVEHLETYVHNTRAFYEVLKQQKSTASFLTVLDEQIARLQSVFFSSDLRSFLKQKERYDEKEYDFLAWCELLKKKALKNLNIDLTDVAYQIDWPILLRLFKLQELQSKINTQSFESEREKFLTNIKTIPKDLWIRVEKLLNANLSQDHLPNPETIKTFEAMIENLKADFDYEAYPQVKLFITHLILQSELDASRLQEEIDRLFIKISHSMMETDVQRKVFELYRHHELLTHLFELQLTPREYEQLSEHREKLSPKTLFENLSALNQDKRIELLNFEGVEEIEKLFEKSFEFYVLAKERDEKMIQNVEEQMQKQKVEKAVVITGGFHAEPFSEYFKEKLYNYALISPKMTDFEGQQSYVESMLQTLQPQSRESASATLESIPFASHSPEQILAMGFDPRQIALIFLDEAYRFLTSENTKFSPAQFNQMAMQGGAFKGFSLSFVKNEQGEDVFKITFPDGTIVYVGQQDVKQVIVRQTVGFDLGNPLNTIPGVSNQTAGTYLKLPQASSPAQSDSALLARPQSRAELRSIGSQNEEIVLKRSKETIVVGPVADPRDEPLSDLSLWTQLFGHRHSDENSISLKDLLADSIEAQQQAKGPFRFMDIGTGNGKIINLLKTRLQRMGLSKIEGVGIESDPGRWGMANSDPDRGYYVTDFLKLDETFPELMQKYDLLTLNAPQLSVRHLETDSQFQVKLLDFSSWLNQIKKIMKENGRLIIRLYEPQFMVDGNEADWLHIESALLQKVLKQHPDLEYTKLGMNIQGLPKGSAPLGPAIVVQFKNSVRAELRKYDDEDNGYDWVIPEGLLPVGYQLLGRKSWDTLIGHRRNREAAEIKFADLVQKILNEKKEGELLQFADIATGDGNFVTALMKVLNDQGIYDVKGIGLDKKNETLLEADLTLGETYFKIDLQNPEEVLPGVGLNSQDFVFMNAPELMKNATPDGRKRAPIQKDFSPWLKRAKSLLKDNGYLIIRLFEERKNPSHFKADFMKIESYLLQKALEDDPDLYFWEVEGDLADLPTGSTSLGPAIIVQKKSRAELRSGVDPLRRNDGGIFPEAVRAVERIAATQNDVRRPVEEQPRRSNVEISAQAEAYQLFMEFTAEQQPELKDKLNEIVIHPADYDQFTRVHQPNVTEAAVISTQFSDWDIRSILNQLKSEALLVIGYESYEVDRASSDMQLLGEIKQEGLLEEFSMGQMPAGQYIIIARKARSELRADDVFLTDANEGSLFPGSVSEIEQIVASQNDLQTSDQKVDFRRMRISQVGAQKAAHQLFTTYAEKQQPQLRESLPSLMIFPTDYEKYQAQRTNKTEVVILSTAFSEYSIRLILESLRADTLLVIGYEDDEKNVLEQHQKFFTGLQSEGLVKEFSSGEMSTGQHILIARKTKDRAELRSKFDEAFKGFAEMPLERTRLLAMIYENLHQNRSNKVAWYTNSGADIIHPLLAGNPDVLVMNDRLDLFSSDDFSEADSAEDIASMALNGTTGEDALAKFQEKGGALLPILMRGFQQLGVVKEAIKAEFLQQNEKDVEQAIKLTFMWKHPAEDEARERIVYFLGRKPLQSLSDLPDEIEEVISANNGLDLMIEKAPNYYKDLLAMDLEMTDRESAKNTSAYKQAQKFIDQINTFRMKWLKKGGVVLGDKESTEWSASLAALNQRNPKQYSNIKFWKTRIYEFLSRTSLSQWGNGASLIYQRVQGQPLGLNNREEKNQRPALNSALFQKAFQYRVGIGEKDNQNFMDVFTRQYDQSLFDLVLNPNMEVVDDYDQRATTALMGRDYARAILVRFEQSLAIIRKGLDERKNFADIQNESSKSLKFIENYFRDITQFQIELDEEALSAYAGIAGIRAFMDYLDQAIFVLASSYAIARPELKDNPVANVFLRPTLKISDFDEVFKEEVLGRGIAFGDSEEFQNDFQDQYNNGLFDDVLNPRVAAENSDYSLQINQAFATGDISKALILMFNQSIQIIRKGLDQGQSLKDISKTVKKITNEMSPYLNPETDEAMLDDRIDDKALEAYGGGLGLQSYVNYIEHAVHLLSAKYIEARSELRTDDATTFFEDSLNPGLRNIILMEEDENNSQEFIPVALSYIDLFYELASHHAPADLEGTAVADVQLFVQEQQLKRKTAPEKSAPILGYDLAMTVLSDNVKSDGKGTQFRIRKLSFEPIKSQFVLAEVKARGNYIPSINDDEYPVLFEIQSSRDKKAMRNVTAVYVGGFYKKQFLKYEILNKLPGRDQLTPMDMRNVIFKAQTLSDILGADGQPLRIEDPNQKQRFISEADLSNILVRASFVDDPRKSRSELRAEDKDDEKTIQENITKRKDELEAESFSFLLPIKPENLTTTSGYSGQLNAGKRFVHSFIREHRLPENVGLRLERLIHEMQYNLIEHGNGAALGVRYKKVNGKVSRIEVVTVDSGEGMKDVNQILGHSTYRKITSFLAGMDPSFGGGNGFMNYMSTANEVTIESLGVIWQKNAVNHFEKIGESKRETGSRVTAVLDLFQSDPGPKHQNYFKERFVFFKLLKSLVIAGWLSPQGDDVDWFTAMMMLSEEDFQKEKSKMFDHESGPIARAVSSGRHETIRVDEYQKIIERAVEFGMARESFPAQTGDRIKLVSEELIQKWNRNYRSDWTLPRSEPGHMTLQYSKVKMYEGPGSVKELELLREAASKLIEDPRLNSLTNNPETLEDELPRVLEVLKEKGFINEDIKTRLLGSIAFLKEAAHLSKTGRIMPGYGDHDDVFMEYYEKTAFIFSVVPVMLEAIFRSVKSSEVLQRNEISDSLVVETETSMHFELDQGLAYRQREQISFKKGVDGLAYFREDPSRMTALFRHSHEMKLPLGHDVRLAMILFRKEFQQWMDSHREKSDRAAFLSVYEHFLGIFESSEPVINTLWELHRSGFLDILIPDFKNVNHLPADFRVHAFTVGQHTLYNLQNFDLLPTRKHLSNVNGKDVDLYTDGKEALKSLSPAERKQMRLALLFHDLGKKLKKMSSDPDHAIVASREIVPVRLREMGLPEDEIANVGWVVREHMVLNGFAREDVSVFETKIPDLSRKYGMDPEMSLDRLRLLMIISLTDREAVNPWAEYFHEQQMKHLNIIYQRLEDHLQTDPEDRFREIDALQRMAHDKTLALWNEYKVENRESLKKLLANITAETVNGYLEKLVIEDSEALSSELSDRVKEIASNNEMFEALLGRLFASFTMEQIRDFRPDQSVRRLLFLIHLDIKKEANDPSPVIYFNHHFMRKYEKGYELVVGAGVESEHFFEKMTGALLLYGFDIESADVRTNATRQIVNKVQGFFHKDYPDAEQTEAMKRAVAKDMKSLIDGTTTVEELFKSRGIPYVSIRDRLSVETKVAFLDDSDIYNVPVSGFNLQTVNRLGLLHAISIILSKRGINLVAAPATTHPSMVNDTFYVNKDGRTLTPEEKAEVAEEIRSVMNKRFIVFSDLHASRYELRSSDKVRPLDELMQELQESVDAIGRFAKGDPMAGELFDRHLDRIEALNIDIETALLTGNHTEAFSVLARDQKGIEVIAKQFDLLLTLAFSLGQILNKKEEPAVEQAEEEFQDPDLIEPDTRSLSEILEAGDFGQLLGIESFAPDDGLRTPRQRALAILTEAQGEHHYRILSQLAHLRKALNSSSFGYDDRSHGWVFQETDLIEQAIVKRQAADDRVKNALNYFFSEEKDNPVWQLMIEYFFMHRSHHLQGLLKALIEYAIIEGTSASENPLLNYSLNTVSSFLEEETENFKETLLNEENDLEFRNTMKSQLGFIVKNLHQLNHVIRLHHSQDDGYNALSKTIKDFADDFYETVELLSVDEGFSDRSVREIQAIKKHLNEIRRSELRVHIQDGIDYAKEILADSITHVETQSNPNSEARAMVDSLNAIIANKDNLDAILNLFQQGETTNIFQKTLKSALVKKYPSLDKRLFFIPVKDAATFSLWAVMYHNNLRLIGGFWTRLVNDKEERKVVFVRSDRKDLDVLFTAAHEVSHFLQDDSALGLVADKNSGLLHRWLVEGYQLEREIEMVTELYNTPTLKQEIETVVDDAIRNPSEEALLLWNRVGLDRNDLINAEMSNKIRFLRVATERRAYMDEGSFVDAIRKKVGLETIRDIHQSGDYTKLEAALGELKLATLRNVFNSWFEIDENISEYSHLNFALSALALSLVVDAPNLDDAKVTKILAVTQYLLQRLQTLSDDERFYGLPGIRNDFTIALKEVFEAQRDESIEALKRSIDAEIDKAKESLVSFKKVIAEVNEPIRQDIRSELRSSTGIETYLPKIQLHENPKDYNKGELIKLVTFVREHNIPDDVLFGRVPDSFDALKKSRGTLKPFEVPKTVKVIDQVSDSLIDAGITLLITESNSVPYHNDLLVIENSTGRLVAAAPIQIGGAGVARRIMPMRSRTFVQGQGYLQRAIQLLLKSKKIAGWRTEALDEGGDTRTGGVSEMYERMLATGDFERVNIRGRFNSEVRLKDLSELRENDEHLDYGRIERDLRVVAADESTPIDISQVEEIMRKLIKGEIANPHYRADIDIIKILPDGSEKVIGPLRPNIAETYGLLHRTSAVFVKTPDGKYIFDQRAPGYYGLHLSISGGHVDAGSNYRDTMLTELLEELGFPLDWKLQNELVLIDREGAFESPAFIDPLESGVPKNNEKRSQYIYTLSDEEYKMWAETAEELERTKASMTQKEFLNWLAAERATDSKFGETFNYVVLDLEDVLAVVNDGKSLVLVNDFKDESLVTDAVLTPDLLGPMLKDERVLAALGRSELREALSQSTTDLPWFSEKLFREFGKFLPLYRLAEMPRVEIYKLLKLLLGREVFAEGFVSDRDQASLSIPFSTQEQAELGILYQALFAKMDQQVGISRKRGVIDYRQFDEKELQNESQLDNLATSLASQLEMAAFAAQHDSNLEYQLWVPEALQNAVHEKLKTLMFKQQAMENLPQNLKIMKYPKNLAQAVDATIQRLDQRVAFVGPQADLLDYRPHLLRGSSEEDPEAQVMVALLLGQELLKESLERSDFYKVYRGSDLYDKWSDLMTAFKSRMAIMASA